MYHWNARIKLYFMRIIRDYWYIRIFYIQYCDQRMFYNVNIYYYLLQ